MKMKKSKLLTSVITGFVMLGLCLMISGDGKAMDTGIVNDAYVNGKPFKDLVLMIGDTVSNIEQIEADLAVVQNDLVVVFGEIDALKTLVSGNSADIAVLQTAFIALEALANQNTADIQASAALIQANDDAIDQTVASINDLYTENANLQAVIDVLEARVAAGETLDASQQDQLDANSAQIAINLGQIAALESDMQAFEADTAAKFAVVQTIFDNVFAQIDAVDLVIQGALRQLAVQYDEFLALKDVAETEIAALKQSRDALIVEVDTLRQDMLTRTDATAANVANNAFNIAVAESKIRSIDDEIVDLKDGLREVELDLARHYHYYKDVYTVTRHWQTVWEYYQYFYCGYRWENRRYCYWWGCITIPVYVRYCEWQTRRRDVGYWYRIWYFWDGTSQRVNTDSPYRDTFTYPAIIR